MANNQRRTVPGAAIPTGVTSPRSPAQPRMAGAHLIQPRVPQPNVAQRREAIPHINQHSAHLQRIVQAKMAQLRAVPPKAVQPRRLESQVNRAGQRTASRQVVVQAKPAHPMRVLRTGARHSSPPARLVGVIQRSEIDPKQVFEKYKYRARYYPLNPFDNPLDALGVVASWMKEQNNPTHLPITSTLRGVAESPKSLLSKKWHDLDKPEILASEAEVARAAIVFEPGFAQSMAQALKMILDDGGSLVPCPNTPPDGKYDFARTRQWLGRDLIVMMTATGGNEGLTRHVNLTREKKVSYAGMALYVDGSLLRWTNWSGHYFCGAWNAYQAGLPIAKFVPYSPTWADI